jgi:hypothetical protein
MKDLLPYLGAGGFGVIVGWYIYYINRYRKGDVQFSDITTLVGVIGGGAVTSLFGEAKQGLFGAYGVGLFLGFFGYFLVLLGLVAASKGVFTWTWFLDGRRRRPASDEEIQGDARVTIAPMSIQPTLSERLSTLESKTQRIEAQATPMNPLAARDFTRAGLQISGGMTVSAVHPLAARIIVACEDTWNANKDDCSKFVVSVAEILGVKGLTLPADAIVDVIVRSPGWRVLDNGVAAKAAADAGEFVIGGLRSVEHTAARTHGHVVVVVSGGLAQGRYPTGYWGSSEGTPYKNSTIDLVWRQSDRDNVHYAAKQLG